MSAEPDRTMCYPPRGGVWPNHDLGGNGLCKRCLKDLREPSTESAYHWCSATNLETLRYRKDGESCADCGESIKGWSVQPRENL